MNESARLMQGRLLQARCVYKNINVPKKKEHVKGRLI
jgi:hypothetical protein